MICMHMNDEHLESILLVAVVNGLPSSMSCLHNTRLEDGRGQGSRDRPSRETLSQTIHYGSASSTKPGHHVGYNGIPLIALRPALCFTTDKAAQAS